MTAKGRWQFIKYIIAFGILMGILNLGCAIYAVSANNAYGIGIAASISKLLSCIMLSVIFLPIFIYLIPAKTKYNKPQNSPQYTDYETDLRSKSNGLSLLNLKKMFVINRISSICKKNSDNTADYHKRYSPLHGYLPFLFFHLRRLCRFFRRSQPKVNDTN